MREDTYFRSELGRRGRKVRKRPLDRLLYGVDGALEGAVYCISVSYKGDHDEETYTLSPMEKDATPSPTPTTVPAPSLPMMAG